MSATDVVVGVDGSPASWRALRWATMQARRRGSRLRIVAAYRVAWQAEENARGTDLNAVALTRAEDLVGEMVRTARGAAPAIVVGGLAACGSPVQVLDAAATDGSLIVVGNRGHGGFESLLLGATGLQLATHAHGPVVVVRGNAEADSGPVIVGADGSPGAEAALGMAFDEAAARAEKYPSVNVQTLVVRGDAASGLVAMSTAAQLLVVGTRGHGGFAGLLLGSVGQKLLHHAHCPVLVAR